MNFSPLTPPLKRFSQMAVQFVIEFRTRFAAFSLLTSIIQSSAYLTKFSPLASSSLSSSFNIILLSNGLKFPPILWKAFHNIGYRNFIIMESNMI